MIFVNFFIKKANNINICFKTFIIKGNPTKNLIKKEILLIIGIDFKFKTYTINIILHYVENKIKFDNITYLIEFKDKKN